MDSIIQASPTVLCSELGVHSCSAHGEGRDKDASKTAFPPESLNSLLKVATLHVRGLITGRSLDKNNIKNACKRKSLSALDD